LKIRTRKAFTLLERTVAIVVLGLAALAIPTFESVISGATYNTDQASAETFGRDVQTNMSLDCISTYSGPSSAITAAEADDSTVTNVYIEGGGLDIVLADGANWYVQNSNPGSTVTAQFISGPINYAIRTL